MDSKPVIVRDYSGHYRIDQADLDACQELEKLRAENFRLRARIKNLEIACDNYDAANCQIGNLLNETRQDLAKAQARIKQLEHIDITVEVVTEDDGETAD